MGYHLADMNGYMADFANISAMRRFSIWAASQRGPVAEFARTGETSKPAELATALKDTSAVGDIGLMRDALLKSATDAKGILLVSDGVGGEDVSPLRVMGDVPGHEFHGNQWTEGSAGANADRLLKEHDRIKEHPGRLPNPSAAAESNYHKQLEGLHIALSDHAKQFPLGSDWHYEAKDIQVGLARAKESLNYGNYDAALSQMHSVAATFVTSAKENRYRVLWPDKDGVDDHGRGGPGSPADHRDQASVHRIQAAALEKASTKEPNKFKRDALVKKAAEHRQQEREHITAALIKEGRIKPSEVLRGLAVTPTGFAFDAESEDAIAWAKEHAAETISGISKTTRENIHDLVVNAFEKSVDVDTLSSQIADVLGNDERADKIARTETMSASNEGQSQAWDQATEDGVLSADAQQEWIATDDERTCPICGDLDGQQVGLDENFESDGDEYDGPPAHPYCRCTVGLVNG